MKTTFIFICFLLLIIPYYLFSQNYYILNKKSSLNEYINRYLAKYDFNNDGLDDLLVGGDNWSTPDKTRIILLINKGDGIFLDSTSFFINGSPKSNTPVATSADFNSDGVLDIAIFDAGNQELGQDPILSGYYGEEAILLLSENGKRKWNISDELANSVSLVKNYNTNGKKLHVKYATTGDINKDGLMDIFVESGGGYKQPLSHFYINKGNGKFEADASRIPQVILNGPNFQWRYSCNQLSDLNNDGYDDLIMGQLRKMSNGQDDMTSIVILNDKNGYFKQENLINLPYSNFNETWNYVRGIIATDINNDGFKDLIFGLCRAATSNSKFPFSGTSFQVLLNQKGVKYVDSTQNYIQNDKYLEAEYDSIRKATNQNEPMSLEYIDMNLDNYKDIFMTRSWQSINKYMPLIMENNTGNYFKAIDSNKISNNTDWVGMVASSIDINGDKLQDIISLSTMPGKDDIYSTADDVMEYIPIIANFTPVIIDSIFYFKEKQNTGTKIGNLNIKDINNKTHSFKLSGINASSFKIDSLGNIYSNDSLSFLYQNNKSLKFSVEAADNYSTTKSNITINIICQPDKPSFINTSYLICTPDSLKLELKNTQNTDSLIWYINNKQDKINQTYIYLKDPTESVYVSRITNLGCKINTDTLKIYKSQKPNTPILSRDADNNLVSNSTGNTWYKDGVKISDTTQKIKPATNGIYTATTTQNGCTSSISQGYYYLTNAVSNLSNNEYFKISPNPTSGELNINYKISSSRNINISIFDINGRAVLLNKKVESGSKVNLGPISKGNYIIQVKDGAGRLIDSQKLVKE